MPLCPIAKNSTPETDSNSEANRKMPPAEKCIYDRPQDLSVNPPNIHHEAEFPAPDGDDRDEFSKGANNNPDMDYSVFVGTEFNPIN